MKDLDDTKPKTERELLAEAVEFLDDSRFKFACFVNSFKRYLGRAHVLDFEDKKDGDK